jgi:glycogen synthase
MRVLMVSQFYPPIVGGQEAHVRNLALALAARGHDVEVATIAVDGNEGTFPDGLVPVHRLHAAAQYLPQIFSDPQRPHSMPIADPQFRAGIRRLLRTGRFDVIHAHDWSVGSALGPARRSGTPVVFTQHDYSHICATKRLMRGDEVCPGPALVACTRCASSQYGPMVGPAVVLTNFASSRARQRQIDTFIPVSSAVAFSTGLRGRCRYEVIPNFIPDNLLLDEAIPHPDGPIVFVGDLSRDKGIDVLIEAYLRLGDVPRLVLAGRILAEIPLDLPERIELLGVIDHDAVMTLMRSASVVAVPSIVPDCCPTVILEAMAAGRPVVAAASGGIVDLVDNGVTGLLVAAGDPIRLAEALSSIIHDVDSATAMGRKALDRVRLFTASAVVTRIERVYERLAAGGRPRKHPRGRSNFT